MYKLYTAEDQPVVGDDATEKSRPMVQQTSFVIQGNLAIYG